MPGLIETGWILIVSSAFNLHLVLVEMHKGNMDTPKYEVGKAQVV